MKTMLNESMFDSKLQAALDFLAANKWHEALGAFEQIRLLAGVLPKREWFY